MGLWEQPLAPCAVCSGRPGSSCAALLQESDGVRCREKNSNMLYVLQGVANFEVIL